MNNEIYLIMFRNIILFIGWPLLVIGSIYLVVKGRHVYGMVKGSLVGKITKALVISMFIEMYSLGIVSTVFMFRDNSAVFIVLPVFAIWFVVFVWSLSVLKKAETEARKISGIK